MSEDKTLELDSSDVSSKIRKITDAEGSVGESKRHLTDFIAFFRDPVNSLTGGRYLDGTGDLDEEILDTMKKFNSLLEGKRQNLQKDLNLISDRTVHSVSVLEEWKESISEGDEDSAKSIREIDPNFTGEE